MRTLSLSIVFLLVACGDDAPTPPANPVNDGGAVTDDSTAPDATSTEDAPNGADSGDATPPPNGYQLRWHEADRLERWLVHHGRGVVLSGRGPGPFGHGLFILDEPCGWSDLVSQNCCHYSAFRSAPNERRAQPVQCVELDGGDCDAHPRATKPTPTSTTNTKTPRIARK
jgi:hypothetical protein